MKKQKVIGIGFHKTGTTTLGDCLKSLGYNHISCSKEAFLLYQASEISAILKLMEFFDSFEDWPWPFLYKEAFEKLPDAKFVLTTRLNEEVWFSSLTRHVKRGVGADFSYRKYIYGCEDLAANKSLHIDKYLQHNQEVRDFFDDKPGKLLELCWEKGDSWIELCDFLEIEAPDLPLPHKKADPQIHKEDTSFMKRLKKSARVLISD